jgi:hypothetical protein
MQFGAVGDLHGDFEALDRIMSRHPDVAFWVCPGDLASESGEYPSPRAPLYWIKGNNEDFDFVASQPLGGGTISNLHYIPNGSSVKVSGLTIAGLGGTFAPTWYETPAAELPAHSTTLRSGAETAGSPTRAPHAAAAREPPMRQPRGGARRGAGPRLALDASRASLMDAIETAGPRRGVPATRNDRRRHFVHEEVLACSQLSNVDVFLTHEAPRPFVLEQSRGTGVSRRVDAGKTPINEVLAALKPRLHLFGHHHRYGVAERQHVTSIGLELVSTSYLIFDGKTLAHQRIAT